MDKRLQAIVDNILRELQRIQDDHEPFNSPHEALGVVLEEVRDLETAVFQHNCSYDKLAHESQQLAARCIRLILDCT